MTANGEEQVGSLFEEAIKLARTLAQEAGADEGGQDHTPETCRVCPLCQLMALLRHAQPEVAEHLVSAMGSLTLALRSVMDSFSQQDTDVEDGGWD